MATDNALDLVERKPPVSARALELVESAAATVARLAESMTDKQAHPK